MAIRVFVVDEIPLVADVLAVAISDERDIEVVGRSSRIDEALKVVDDVDVFLVSGTLPHDEALIFCGKLMQSDADAQVLVTGIAESKGTIVRFVEAGAAGYVLRDDTTDDLLANIRAAYDDKALVSPEATMAIMQRMSDLAEQRHHLALDDANVEDLTPREREVLRYIYRGFTNQQIANGLTIELGTVKNHVHSILTKLNVRSRYDAAAIQGMLEELERP